MEFGAISKLFEKYHGCCCEIQDTREMMKEAEEEGDGDMKKMLDEDLMRLLGTQEEYGEIEEL